MEEDSKKEARKILKNILLISFVYLLYFTGFLGLSRLQSSLHKDAGIGVITSGIYYLMAAVFSFLLPKIMLTKIGNKWTLAISILLSTLWMAANGYAVWATMVPTAILAGVMCGPIWAAQGSYFTALAPKYAKLTSNTVDNTITRFFGILLCFFQSSAITGSLISSLVLDSVPVNATIASDDPILDFCGANACPNHNISNPNVDKPPALAVFLMLGIYILIALFAVFIVAVFVDPLPAELRSKEPLTCRSVTSLLFASAKLYKRKEAILLFPITMYVGVEVAFFAAEFSNSYISCSIGIWNVGYVTLPFGIVNALTSILSTWVAKYTGQLPLFISAFIVDLSSQLTMMFWMPKPDQAWVLYVLSGMWGYIDGIWQTHVLSLYGIIFVNDTEAAFSCRSAVFSIGAFIGFGYSHFLCTSTKLYILTTILIIGMAGYLATVIPKMRKEAGHEMKPESMREKPAIQMRSELVGCTNKAFNTETGGPTYF